MEKEVFTWIVNNMETWEAICRVNGHNLKGESVLDTFQMLLKKSRYSQEFEVLFMVFLTEYEHELPFFGGEEGSANLEHAHRPT